MDRQQGQKQIPALPAFRFGDHYDSLTRSEVASADGRRVLATMGLVNPGLIRRDLQRRAGSAFTELQSRPVSEMVTVCEKAAALFVHEDLPVCEGGTQTPEDYVRLASSACGMPHTLIRANMGKIEEVLAGMRVILKGLTRGLDSSAIDTCIGRQDDVPVSYYPAARHLGLVLPGNSPGVHSLWVPAVARGSPPAS